MPYTLEALTPLETEQELARLIRKHGEQHGNQKHYEIFDWVLTAPVHTNKNFD